MVSSVAHTINHTPVTANNITNTNTNTSTSNNNNGNTSTNNNIVLL